MTPENTGKIQAWRSSNGQFTTVVSGNPAGRPKGARNKSSLAAEALLEGQAEAITQKLVDLAEDGDRTDLRLVMERIVPARRSRPMQFDLPKSRRRIYANNREPIVRLAIKSIF